MENRFVARSGVLLGLGDTNGHYSYNRNDPPRYKSPQRSNPSLLLLNGQSPELSPSMITGLTGLNPLIDVNLPAHMFSQAVNFESIQQSNHVEMQDDEMEDFEPEDQLVQNSSINQDNQADILEQQQAREQAKLLTRFKELRQWQLQQQEVLMLQQQNQLLALKTEQQRVQGMIAKQRQIQWGSKGNVHPGEPSPFISPKKRTVRPAGAGIAQALAGGIVQQYKQIHGTTDRDTANDHPRGQLPRPLLPDSDSDGGSYHGPELYSDVGSVDSHDEPDDRLCSLPPTDRDMDSNGLHQMPGAYAQGEINNARISKSDMLEVETDEGIGTQSFRSSPVLMQHGEDGLKEGPTGCNNDNNGIYLDDVGHDRLMVGPAHSRDDDQLPDEVESGQIQMNYDDIDERPVSSAVGGKKTFEELLEQHLRAEEEKSSPPASAVNEKTPRRPFLRRGQGLARFMAPPKKKECLNTGRPAAQATRTEPARNPPVKKISSTKGNNFDVPKSANRAVSKPTSRAKPEGSNPIASSMGKAALKKSTIAPKPGQGVPGIAQKSLKLGPPVSKSVSVSETQINSTEVSGAKVSAIGGSNEKIPHNHQLNMNKIQSSRSGEEWVMVDNSGDPVKTVDPSVGHLKSVNGSFFSSLNKIPENEQVEEEELEEFEMLEHFADNASFSSNSSLVVRVLQKDKAKAAQYQNGLSSSGVLSYPPDSHQTFFKDPYMRPDVRVGLEGVDVEEEDHNETLETSSCSESEDSSDTEVEELLSTVKTLTIQAAHEAAKDCDTQQGRSRTLDICDRTEETRQHGDNNQRYISDRDTRANSGSSSDEDTRHYTQDRSKSPLKRKIAGREDHNPVSPVLPGVGLMERRTKREYSGESESSEDESRLREKRPYSLSVNHNDVPSQHTEEGDQNRGEEFDDGEEWGDTSMRKVTHRSRSSDGSDADDTLVEETKSKIFPGSSQSRPDVYDTGSTALPSPPPTSKLVTKLFPKLRPPKPSPKEQERKDRLQSAKESAVGDGINSKILRDKLQELELEITKFRTENSSLERLRKEREEGLSKLKKEISDFEKEKNEELHRLQEFKAQEIKKLKHEKKVFEKYQKAARDMPDKKEREEIETLKSQLLDVQEELKRKESRWTSSTARLKSRVEDLEKENSELKEEIRLLEKKRIGWLQKEQAQKSAGGYFTKNDARLMNSTPSHNFPPNNAAATSGFINTDSDEEMDPVKDDKRKMQGGKTRPIAKSESTYRPVNKPDTTNQRQHERPVSANHRTDRPPKSTNQKSSKSAPSSNHKPEKSVSPSKPSHKSTLRGLTPKAVNVMRTSLTEDLPRRQFTAAATPQDVSMNGDRESDISNVTGQKHRSTARKMATRFNVDKSSIDKGGAYDEIQHPDGKLERIYSNGAREILFSNGTRKEISSDGQSIIVCFFNGDIKQIMSDQRVVYYYSEAQTTHTTYPDGLEVLQFPNNQVEKHYPDGTKEITFPDQTIKYLFPSGVEESIFTDGTVIRVEKSGDKTIEFPNGQREIHTEQYKKREYPDGTVKTVFPDGRQETRYSNGRIRVKDRDGNVIVDKRS